MSNIACVTYANLVDEEMLVGMTASEKVKDLMAVEELSNFLVDSFVDTKESR